MSTINVDIISDSDGTGKPDFSNGLTSNGDANFGDGDKAIFGAGSDLQIYHDGSNSYVAEGGTGDLILQGAGQLHLKNSDNDEYYVICNDDGAVQIRHDNATKLATTSTGVDITGTLTSDGLLVQSTSGSTTGTIRSDAGSNSVLYLDTQDTSSASYITASGSLAIATGSGTPERLRVDSSGNLLVGTSGTNWQTTAGLYAFNQSALNVTRGGAESMNLNRLTSDGDTLKFHKGGTAVGSISVTGSATAYNTSSDYRLKTDAQQMTGASARVQALNPVNFEWLSDGTRVDGFLAHEAQEVVPECATGTRDGMKDEEYEVTPEVLDDYGSVTTEAEMGTRSVPDMQGIDQSKLVPLLTAALQEALAAITDLKARVAVLEEGE